MSCDTEVLLPHRLRPEDLEAVVGQLGEAWCSACRDGSGGEDLPWSCELGRPWRGDFNFGPLYSSLAEQWEGEGEILTGGGGVAAHIFRHTVSVSFGVYFASFLTEEDVQQRLRLAVARMAKVLSAPAALYVSENGVRSEPGGFSPEDAAADGWTFEAILERLQAEYGPPAADLRSIYSEHPEYWTFDGYFLERW